MAPTKSTRAVSKTENVAPILTTTSLMPLARKGLTRRNATNVQDQNIENIQTRGKRKAEHSPQKNDSKMKRSALGNLTNNVNTNNNILTLHPDEDVVKQQISKKKDVVQAMIAQHSTTAQVLKEAQNFLQQQHQHLQQKQAKIPTRASVRTQQLAQKENTNITSKPTIAEQTDKKQLTTCKEEFVPAAPAHPLPHHQIQKVTNKPVRRISNEFNKTEESLYMSALEDVSGCDSLRLSGNFEAARRRSALVPPQKTENAHKGKQQEQQEKQEIVTEIKEVEARKPPQGVEDFDKAHWNDPFQVSHYAFDIFSYLKERESEFPIDDYMQRQVHLTKWMRSLLVDWMVEVQETFELNHETLYLAVKIVDLYLCKTLVIKDKLQLLGAAALFIACKFDERQPPLIEDFLYICDGAYKHDELKQMEMTTLRTIDFDLGIPLSYRFLRRYARCIKLPMATLTLARYILELSLMDYDCIAFSDSKMACAALFMAMRLHGDAKPWNATLQYYSGYQLSEFADIVPILNAGMSRKAKGTIKTIRSKYSHKIFHEVAKVTLMTTEELFKDNLDYKIPAQQLQQQQHSNKTKSEKQQQNVAAVGGGEKYMKT